MIIDSSALVAIVLQEPEADALLQRMRDASSLAIGAATLLETGIVLSARLNDDARGLLARLLQESGIAVVDVKEAHFGVAMDAWLRYGKGRHAAKRSHARARAMSATPPRVAHCAASAGRLPGAASRARSKRIQL